MSENEISTTLPSTSRRRSRRKRVTPELLDEIRNLHSLGYGTRRIRDRVGLSRNEVQRILAEEGLSPAAGASRASSAKKKLASFGDLLTDKVKKGLTATRILRELHGVGYTGGRTILSDQVRRLKTELALAPKTKVKRRFETPPGEEMQIDWSPYRVLIAARLVVVHAFACLLCASRKLFVRFFRDERQPMLLEGLASAFEYFDGCALRVVLDNMSTAVLGRYGPDGKPIWHPRFADFVRHYGFTPFACAPADPDRKGKKEKSFRLVWDDFLKGTEFTTWDQLDERRRVWLDHTPEVANLRVHGTTRRIPNDEWRAERELLIRLPQHRFPVYEDSVRVVDQDSTLSIRGTRYSVPAALACRSLAVHLFAEHFEILEPAGRVAFSRRYVPDADKGKLILDPTHYANLPRRPTGGGGAGQRLDDAFVKRFPALAPFVQGLKLRVKSLAPIHLRALLRLVDRYGEEAFVAAAGRAQEYRRFDARAVERILERRFPLAPDVEAESVPPLRGAGPAVLGDVEPGSLEGYGDLDQRPADATPADAASTGIQSTSEGEDEEGTHGP